MQLTGTAIRNSVKSGLALHLAQSLERRVRLLGLSAGGVFGSVKQ